MEANQAVLLRLHATLMKGFISAYLGSATRAHLVHPASLLHFFAFAASSHSDLASSTPCTPRFEPAACSKASGEVRVAVADNIRTHTAASRLTFTLKTRRSCALPGAQAPAIQEPIAARAAKRVPTSAHQVPVRRQCHRPCSFELVRGQSWSAQP